MESIQVIEYYTPWINGSIDSISDKLKRTPIKHPDFKLNAECYKQLMNMIYDYMIAVQYTLEDEDIREDIIDETLGIYEKCIINMREARESLERTFLKTIDIAYTSVHELLNDYINEKLKQHKLNERFTKYVNTMTRSAVLKQKQ